MSLLFNKKNKADDGKEKFRTNVKLINSYDEEELDENNFETIRLWKSPMAKRSDGKVSKGTVIKALYMANGIKAIAARALGVSRRSLGRWIDKDDDIGEAFRDAKECVGDFSESKLIECIDKRHPWAIEIGLKFRSDYNDNALAKTNNKGKILASINKMLDGGESSE